MDRAIAVVVDDRQYELSLDEEQSPAAQQAEQDALEWARANRDFPEALGAVLSPGQPSPGAQLEAAWGTKRLAEWLDVDDRRQLPKAKALYSKAYIRRLILFFGARELGRRGGRNRSLSKQLAARLNGKKGGRPYGTKETKPRAPYGSRSPRKPAVAGKRVWRGRLEPANDERQQELL